MEFLEIYFEELVVFSFLFEWQHTILGIHRSLMVLLMLCIVIKNISFEGLSHSPVDKYYDAPAWRLVVLLEPVYLKSYAISKFERGVLKRIFWPVFL